MTAEIAVMNKLAVALAADSAVTTGEGSNQKTYNSVNKLFALSRSRPVGVMIYGNAELLGIPWETVIKAFRDRHGEDRLSHLRDYLDRLLDFIATDPDLVPRNIQSQYVGEVLSFVFLSLRSGAEKGIEEALAKKGSLSPAEIGAIVSGEIVEFHARLFKQPFAPGFSDNDRTSFASEYGTEILDAKKHFGELPLPSPTLIQLDEIAFGLFAREKLLPHKSGVVIAGYGEDEYYPALAAFEIDGLVLGRPRVARVTNAEIGVHNSAVIKPFAQMEMARTFLDGINPKFHSVLKSYLVELLANQYPEAIERMFKEKKGTALSAELRDGLSGAGGQLVEKLFDELDSLSKDQHWQPIVSAIAVLPKDELASVAEALVSLTSFKQRVTLDTETVGGPIDVAVISKGDGFIWIKRKHYFRPELNTQYFVRNYRYLGMKESNSI